MFKSNFGYNHIESYNCLAQYVNTLDRISFISICSVKLKGLCAKNIITVLVIIIKQKRSLALFVAVVNS